MRKRTFPRFGGIRRAAIYVMLPALVTSTTLAGVVFPTGTANAETVSETLTYVAVADAYTSNARPNLNTGTATTLNAGRFGLDTMITYLKFEVGILPAGSTVDHAEVKVTKAERFSQTVQIAQSAGNRWEESTLTNSNRSALEPTLSAISPAADATSVSFPVTSAVPGAGVYSFTVTSPVIDDVASLRSKEYGSGAPVLTLTISKPVNQTPAQPAGTEPPTKTLSYPAVADAYTSNARPSLNTGAATTLNAGKLGADTMVTYLKFQVGTLPADSTVKKVEVQVTKADRLSQTVQIAQATGTGWNESTLTNSNRPGLGATLAAVSPAANATSVSLPVTSVVAGSGTYAFAITSPLAGDVASLRSKEYGSTSAPVLTVTVSLPCTVDAKLVPTCNMLWGAAAGGFTDVPRDQALREWEEKSGRTASVYHTYHRGDELFPNKYEIAMANEPGKPRLLFTNWKVSYGTTWAAIARGEADARIDRLATYIKANYTDKFFMTLHHEPENNVNNTPGSGHTAKDYAAMYRHTVQRLRAQGVTNVVFVVAYLAMEYYYSEPWWPDLYPGDDVVDWIGVDSYVNAQPGGFHYGTLHNMLNRTNDPAKFPGFYNWYKANHAGKPLMLAEWGVHEYAADPAQKATIIANIHNELSQYPELKAMFWFDTPKDQNGADIRIDSSPLSLVEFRKVAADPRFMVTVR